MGEKKRIAIIGGGYTGLTAAYKLLQKGHSVTIYERAPVVGGLAAGFTIENAPFERAYHHLFRTDTDIISLLEELGIKDILQWYKSSIAIYSQGKMFPFMTPVDLITFSPVSLLDRVRTGLVYLFLQKAGNWRQFVSESAFEWMKKYCGTTSSDVIWEPLLKGKFHQYYKEISMAWLWARIYTRGRSKAPGEVEEKLGYPTGGFEKITKTLVEKITNLGGDIQTNIGISKVDEKNGRVVVQIEEKDHTFDALVATTPSAIFASLVKESSHVTPKYITQLNSVNYLGAVLYIFSSEQSLSNYYWHNINESDAPFLVFIEHTNLTGTTMYNGKRVYYIGSYVPHDHEYMTMENDKVIERWQNYLKKIFPDFDPSQIREQHFFKFKNAQHVVTRDYVERIPEKETPIPGVFLSNFTQIFPEDRGTNFAVRDGKIVAELVDEYLKK